MIRLLWLRWIVVVSMVMYTANYCHGQQAFSIQPEATFDLNIGDSVLMLCSVTDKEGVVTWVKDGTTALSNERTIISSENEARFAVTGDDTSGSFNLQITDLVESDTGIYQCRVSASGSSEALTSTDAQLTVTPIPVQTFTSQPSDAQGIIGNSVTLPCVVENKEGALEWLKDDTVISNDSEITDTSLTRYNIVGSASAGEYNLQIVTLENADMGTYVCRVAAAGNSPTITSTEAILTIRDSSEIQSIVIPPSAMSATVGTSASMVCYVSAKAGSVLWIKDGVQISRDRDLVNGDSSGRITIAGTDEEGLYELRFSSVEEGDEGVYFCVITAEGDQAAVSSSPATLSVTAAIEPNTASPECSLTPASILSEGDVVTIKCESTGGSPQPTLTWSNDLDPNAFTGNQTDEESSASNSITFPLTKELSGVVYTCRSTHPAYSEPKECSLPALSFNLIATINVTAQTNRLTIEEDKPGEIICSASGDPVVLGYRWYYNGAEIEATDDRFVIETTNGKDASTLTISSATLSMDDSTVQCEAYNRIDQRLTSIVLTIKEDNLTTYVLAALGLIATIIFVAIVIGFIVWVCHRMNKKKRTIHPDPEAGGMTKGIPNRNFFIGATHMDGLPNGDIKAEVTDEKKKHKKHRKHKKDKKDKKDKKHKKDKSKVLEHDSTRAPNPLSTRDGDHDVLPTITGYRRPGTNSRDPGVYPTYPPMYPIDGHSPLPHYQDGYPAADPGSAPRSSRRDSKDKSGQNGKISLSPGEYQKRDEYERKLRELQGLRSDLAAPEPEKKKKKHKKHKKDKS
ncbi:kin of IRRE-like protein 1 [Lytechinus variegatus]|uniref:kin of IRRE-like protein 1 n=1 Tax=Lytechinus variegatus TaxID=7654 RepID=UPI001BB13D62|nr:kin of IRRE-like protein 1 [Lytechinus variegatus]XP_041470935.1 kin of IRRE-like protein 1 [Lytechinus variegatus]